MSIRQGFFSLYSLPSLGLFFSSSLCCVSLYCEPVIIHLGGEGGGVWLVKGKWKRLQWFFWLGFSFCSITILLCVISCTIKLTHSCCAFFYRGVSYYFPTLTEGTGKKLNRPAKLSNEFESYLCKETSWFLTMEGQKNCMFIPLSKYVTSSKQLTHEYLRKAASWNILKTTTLLVSEVC